MLKNEKSQEGKLATETRSPLASGDRVSVEQAIFATIAYYDHFNYPLTADEIYYYLVKTDLNCHPEFISGSIRTEKQDEKILKQVQDDRKQAQDDKKEARNNKKESSNDSGKSSFLEIIETLDNSEQLKKTIGRKNGFYFLAGREEIIISRIKKKKLTDEKFKSAGGRIKWILKFISYLPFTRLIMASGTMALGNPGKESDIDLLVVAKSGRIWTTRALMTFFALAFGVYRHKEETENRLCFNHYITDKSLVIDFGNLYKAQEYLNLVPIAGNSRLCDEFLAANREWMEKYVWLAGGKNCESLRTVRAYGISFGIKTFFEWILSGSIGDVFEKWAKKFQINFIEKNPLSSNPSARIKYTDENLVFHPVLVEPKIIAEYEGKMREFDRAIT